MVTPFFHALWILCVLGTGVFASISARSKTHIGALSAGFFITVLYSFWRPEALPDAAFAGGAASSAAFVALFRPRYRPASTFIGGVLAGWIGPLSGALGLPTAGGVLLAALLISATIYFSRRNPDFAPESMCDEALAGLVVFGAVVAVIPGILAGWQSAIALNMKENGSVGISIPAWTLALGGTSVLMGGVYAIWRRR